MWYARRVCMLYCSVLLYTRAKPVRLRLRELSLACGLQYVVVRCNVLQRINVFCCTQELRLRETSLLLVLQFVAVPCSVL